MDHLVGRLSRPRPRQKKCEHNNARYVCKACGGSQICEHGRVRSWCRPCGGSQICQHNRQRPTCKECGGQQICEHNRVRNVCKACGGAGICEHERVRSDCKECGGSKICEHNRQRSVCKQCGGSQICVHNRERHVCKACGGAGICVHNRVRSVCKECGGSSICQHNRIRSSCKECGGSQICQHNRYRPACKECGGSQICVHNRERRRCVECGGASICQHKRRRSRCKECGGSQICEHNRQRHGCVECGGPGICKHNRVRSRCKECGKESGISKGLSGQRRERNSGIKQEGISPGQRVVVPDSILPIEMDIQGVGRAAVSRKPSGKQHQQSTVATKREDELMVQEDLAEGKSKSARKEGGGARERAEARMLEAAIRASLEAPGREEEAVRDAGRNSPSAALLVSCHMDPDRRQRQAVKCPLMKSDIPGGKQICAGKRVEVLFGDGTWYPGTVSNVSGDRWAAVSFDDGDRFTVQFPDPAIRLLDDMPGAVP